MRLPTAGSIALEGNVPNARIDRARYDGRLLMELGTVPGGVRAGVTAIGAIRVDSAGAGYNATKTIVSSFSRAYRQRLGQSPTQTRQACDPAA